MALADARLFHVNINCSDLDRSRAFYCDGLGFTAATRTNPEAAQAGAAFGLEDALWDAWILTGTRGMEGGVLDLLEWQQPRPTGVPPVSYSESGFQRLGVGVTDLAATIEALRAAGGTVWSDPIIHRSEVAGEVHLVHASDPDGTGMELFQGRGPALAFVSVVCTNLERSVRWYESLGFAAVARFPSSGDDGAPMRVEGAYAFEEVLLRPPGGGATSVMLVGFETPAPVSVGPRPANALGIWRAAFLVSDLDARCSDLTALGVELLSPITSMALGPGLPDLRFVCFRGPDAEVLELIETPT